ncbi:MAG TPA: sulfurtransferase TusA family protein, partial [Nitrospirota bacterium]
ARALIETKEELKGYINRAFDYYVAHGKKKERFGHTLDRTGVDRAFSEIFSEEKKSASAAAKQDSSPAARRNFLDLRGVCCPLNFVKAKLAMDKIKSGETIEFYLDDGEPIVNVTRSLKDEGHQVLLVLPQENYFKVLAEKG